MGYTNNNIQIEQIKKYIKVPDRRLISGILYVNVVNHNDNDSSDDFVQQCYDKNSEGSSALEDSIKYSNSFADSSNATQTLANRGRANMKHSFADYDCFMFYVCGGMSLSGGAVAPSGLTTLSGGSALASATPAFASESGGNYYWVTGGAQLTSADLSATWYVQRNNPYGDYCSHFVKYHLISRINNASGHDLATNGSLFFKHLPTLTKKWTTASLTHSADPPNVSDEYILSHGTYDTTNSLGASLGASSTVSLGTGNSNSDFEEIDNSADGDINDDGNTYFSPVDRIAIYGHHNFAPASHTVGSTACWSTAGTGAVHDTDFWSLVIDIGLRGSNASGSSSAGSSSKAIMKSQVNVSFQPFGETQTFNVSDSAHTS